MSIGERIRARREELGLSQAELAKKIGITQGSVGNYESGVSNPKMELVPKLFDALEIDANYLFGEAPREHDFTYSESLMIQKHRALDEHGRKIVDFILDEEFERCSQIEPAKSENRIEIRISQLAASAGTGDPLSDEGYETITVRRTPESERADFAIRVNGDSMETTYSDGDILLVESAPQINVGDIGVFVVNGDGFVKEFGGDRLISHNTAYGDIMLHDYDMIMCSGRVIGIAEPAK